MSVWLTEKEFHKSEAAASGVTLNVAFMKEIKSDFGFRSLLNQVYYKLNPKVPTHPISPRVVADLLCDLRDELETYFALEEFYGYFKLSTEDNPSVNRKAIALWVEHEELFQQLDRIVEQSEQIVYGENPSHVALNRVADDFEKFCIALAQHEQAEMDLMMRLCNEDIGGCG